VIVIGAGIGGQVLLTLRRTGVTTDHRLRVPYAGPCSLIACGRLRLPGAAWAVGYDRAAAMTDSVVVQPGVTGLVW
jgi:hypothetical protein